ncbi:GerAB/ArcD/ProY family transporter [Clostridium manihotivorum]|uniref:Spore gernimation protein n=1 Tax=Clostridium manihotivorum TaxID=2320868 RepID=A0A3R5U7Q1_9CLOT|nr:GerAB/ArcD/ProY family transporter [Clostridium manihotivorum]QAA31031.1 spore gernimation protein [Clostridium manihotivorum]
MIKEGKMGLKEAVCLTVIIIAVKIYFVSPSGAIRAVGTAAWYMTLISNLTAMLGFLFIYLLLKRFPGKDLIFAFKASFGRLLGIIASLILAIMLLLCAAALTREFSEVSKIYIIPNTPLKFHICLQLIVISFLTYLGIETIARFAKLIAYFILLSLVGTIIMNYNHFDYSRLFPILGYGLKTTVTFGLKESSYYGEVVILGVIASSLQGIQNLKKSGFTSLLISSLLISSVYLAITLIFRYGQSQEPTSVLYTLTQIIQIGFFFNRLDPIFIFSWSLGTLVSVSALFYCYLSAYCKTFNIDDMRPLILPSALVFFAISMIPKDLVTLMSYIVMIRQYGWTVFFVMPLLALIAAILRKKKVIEGA